LEQLLATSSIHVMRPFLHRVCGSALQTFKEREDEASQLNRLGAGQ
jgi:hypothetical protein